jgi:hypothetical protein
MRRFLFGLSLALFAVSFVACDEAAVKQGAAEAADAAAGSAIPEVALVGSIISGLLGAFGIKRAGVGQRYAEGGWSKEEVDELVVALRGHGYKVEKSA